MSIMKKAIRVAFTVTVVGIGFSVAAAGTASALPTRMSHAECNRYADDKNWQMEQNRDPGATVATYDRYECVPDVRDVHGTQLYKVIIRSGHV